MEKIDKKAKLIFFGTNHSIRGGALTTAINALQLSKLIFICRRRNISEIITLQLKGGYQDPDITSIVAEELSRRLALDFLVFPPYRSVHNRNSIYTIMPSTAKSNPKL